MTGMSGAGLRPPDHRYVRTYDKRTYIQKLLHITLHKYAHTQSGQTVENRLNPQQKNKNNKNPEIRKHRKNQRRQEICSLGRTCLRCVDK